MLFCAPRGPPYDDVVPDSPGSVPHWSPPGWSGRAGVARCDITPPLGIRMRNWGYGDADVSLGVHRPITATALAVAAGDPGSGAGPADPLGVLITADLGWWRTRADEEGVRGRVAETTGLPPERILLHLTHTHAGPSICAEDADLPGGELVPGYLELVAERIAAAAREAIAGMRDVEWVVATTSHPLAAVRALTADGTPLLAFDPGQAPDQTLLAGRIADAEGRVLATVVNYACHPTTLGHDNDRVSPDFVGAARELLEARYDAPCLFLQGASGELAPRLQYVADPAVADRHGDSLGLAAIAALETLPSPGAALAMTEVVQSGAPLGIWTEVPARRDETVAHAQRAVRVEVKELPPIEQLEREWAGIDPRSRQERLRRARRLRATYDDLENAVHPLWVWRLGGLAIVAHPGEAYSALQSRLRARFPGSAILVLNLVNGPGWVYLPPREAYEADRYQSWQTILRPGSLEALVEAADAALTGLGLPRAEAS